MHRTEVGLQGTTWSPDSSLLAMVAGSSIVLVATETWTEETRLHGHNDVIGNTAFDKSGHRLVSCSFDGDVRIWNLARADRRPRVGSSEAEALTPRFSRDGKWLAVPWYKSGLVEVWCVPERRLARSVHLGRRFDSFDLSPDGRRMLLHSAVGRVTVIDPWNDRVLGEIADVALHYQHYNRAAVRFSPDGARISIVGSDGRLGVWDATSLERLWVEQAYPEPSSWPWSLGGGCWSPDGKKIATLPADGRVRIWDAERGRLVTEWRGRGSAWRHGVFSSDSRCIHLAGAVEHGIECWDVEHRECLWEFAREPPSSLDLSADGTRLFCARAAAVDVRDTRSGELILTLDLDPFLSHGFAASPADDTIVTASTRGLRIWNTTTR